MKITESRSPRGVTLFVSGQINDGSSSQLMNEIFRASRLNPNVTLDFGDVVSINQAGIGSLQAGQRACGSKRGSLKVQNANPAVKYELHNEGLGRLLMF
ncbi:MAG: STAS domain-containing protein [Oscillospiraceae bacterium]|nr:STAS domain-containing protein [Oscillospiraceae bacterium]